MIYDIHVHVAQWHRHATTDRFLRSRRNWPARRALRRMGAIPDGDERHMNERIQTQLLEWIDQSNIDRVVLLAMDAARHEDGRIDNAGTAWSADNDFVADLADRHDAVLFGTSIHPYRPDARRELDRLVARGACLVKWIPSAQRIRLDDARCTAFYEALAHYRLPLLVHTGNEHTSGSRRNGWNDPVRLAEALRRGATVIAAHCGARMFLHERCHFATFCRMAREHEHLYGDISACGIPTRIGMLRRLLKDDCLADKVVYGSDFPAFPMPRWFALSIGLDGAGRVLRESNPLERPYRLMREMGFSDDVFHRAGDLLRLTERVEVAT